MAKYVPKRLAQKKKRTKKRGHFLLGMFIYAVLFLLLTAGGLKVFWEFIEAYELSRPVYAVDRYMEQLTVDHIYDNSTEFTSQLNYDLQSEETCRQMVAERLSEEFTYARKASASTENSQVYVLSSGEWEVGTITITAQAEDEYGFTPWKVTESSFDLMEMLGGSISMTIPAEYTLSVNGAPLDSSYITVSGITFDALEPFNDSYQMPTMVTYEAGPFLGEPEVTVLDAQGGAVTVAEEALPDYFLDNCTDAEKTELDAFIKKFIELYIAFSGSANRAQTTNYNRLVAYVAPDSELKDRLYASIEGLHFAQSRGDKLVDMTMNRYVNMGSDHYLCDVTYLVDTTGHEGVVQTTTNMKIIVIRTEDGLLVEAMSGY